FKIAHLVGVGNTNFYAGYRMKVKCDSQRPCCGTCAKDRLTCTYTRESRQGTAKAGGGGSARSGGSAARGSRASPAKSTPAMAGGAHPQHRQPPPHVQQGHQSLVWEPVTMDSMASREYASSGQPTNVWDPARGSWVPAGPGTNMHDSVNGMVSTVGMGSADMGGSNAMMGHGLGMPVSPGVWPRRDVEDNVGPVAHGGVPISDIVDVGGEGGITDGSMHGTSMSMPAHEWNSPVHGNAPLLPSPVTTSVSTPPRPSHNSDLGYYRMVGSRLKEAEESRFPGTGRTGWSTAPPAQHIQPQWSNPDSGRQVPVYREEEDHPHYPAPQEHEGHQLDPYHHQHQHHQHTIDPHHPSSHHYTPHTHHPHHQHQHQMYYPNASPYSPLTSSPLPSIPAHLAPTRSSSSSSVAAASCMDPHGLPAAEEWMRYNPATMFSKAVIDDMLEMVFEFYYPGFFQIPVHETILLHSIWSSPTLPFHAYAMAATGATLSQHPVIQQFKEENNVPDWRAGDAFFWKAVSMLDEEMRNPTVDTVHGLAHLAQYAHADSCMGYFTRAVDLALRLRINVDPDIEEVH
ncbi:hypothetical protein HK104_004081, partial [Borealophlyctis nickersoniae]